MSSYNTIQFTVLLLLWFSFDPLLKYSLICCINVLTSLYINYYYIIMSC